VRAQEGLERLARAHVEYRGDRGTHPRRLTRVGERHEERAAGERIAETFRGCDGEARLADAPGADERQQPRSVRQLLVQLCDLVGAPDERRRPFGQTRPRVRQGERRILPEDHPLELA
jgi:hypothetical protein